MERNKNSHRYEKDNTARMKIARVINSLPFERDAIYKFCRLANMLYMHIE